MKYLLKTLAESILFWLYILPRTILIFQFHLDISRVQNISIKFFKL